jgi:hypothetical protein
MSDCPLHVVRVTDEERLLPGWVRRCMLALVTDNDVAYCTIWTLASVWLPWCWGTFLPLLHLGAIDCICCFAYVFRASRGYCCVTFGIDHTWSTCDHVIFWTVLPAFSIYLIIVHVLLRTGDTQHSFAEALSDIWTVVTVHRTAARRITMFQSMTDRIFDGGPIRF